jgi:hypothetical protein
MHNATFVAFVPSKIRNKLRRILMTENTAPLAWREQRTMFGSEFYISGPSVLARKAQAYISEWVLCH